MTYYLDCEKHTNNMASRSVTMTNKAVCVCLINQDF